MVMPIALADEFKPRRAVTEIKPLPSPLPEQFMAR